MPRLGLAIAVCTWLTFGDALRQAFSPAHLQLLFATPRSPAGLSQNPLPLRVASLEKADIVAQDPPDVDAEWKALTAKADELLSEGPALTAPDISGVACVSPNSDKSGLDDAWPECDEMVAEHLMGFERGEIFPSIGWQALLGLTEVDFVHCDLDDESAMVIAQQLLKMAPTVKKVNFRGNPKLSPAAWEVLLEPFTQDGINVQEVNFADCNLDDEKALAMGFYLQHVKPSLRKMIFSGNAGMPVAAWQYVLGSMTVAGPNFEEIDFGQCALDYSCAVAIAEQVKAMQPTVSTLRFGSNGKLSQEGWIALLKPMTLGSSNLREVDFEGCDLDDKRAEMIGKYLEAMQPSVQMLSFAKTTNLSQAGWSRLLNPMTVAGSGLHDIDFSDCDLDDAVATTIGQQLANVAPTVQKIKFRGNRRLSKLSWELLLKTLALPSTIEAIDFSDCNLNKFAAASIAWTLDDIILQVKDVDFRGATNLSPQQWRDRITEVYR